GSVERLYENLPLVGGKLRETLAASRKQALLSHELASLSRSAPVTLDLEAFRRVEPDWVRLRGLWMEMEFTRLVKELPATQVAVSAEPVARLDGPAALADYLAKVPAGAPLAVDWVGDARPPVPRIDAVGLFHPAAGAAWFAGRPLLGERELIVHDAKPLLEAWLAAGTAPAVVQDTALAAYLLNPARATYKLDEVCMESFGECPPTLPAPPAEGRVVDDALGGVLGDRARWLVRYWKHAAADLDERELRRIYDEIERPLVPVLADMEQVGIRVEPGRLEAFAKELERNLDNLTREIHELAGEEFAIASPRQLAHILFEKLKLPALRRTKTGYSTDAAVLEELVGVHPVIQPVLDWRIYTKLRSTYVEALPSLIADDGRVHTTFHQAVASTGRLSSSDPNLQNIPIRTSPTCRASRPSSPPSSRARTSTRAPPARCSRSSRRRSPRCSARSPRARTTRSCTASPRSGSRRQPRSTRRKPSATSRPISPRIPASARSSTARWPRAASAATSPRCSAAAATCPTCARAIPSRATPPSGWP
ncbi:MAG: hypothetical protein E6K82_18360, partial [Candidatus Rokuibacteriota bacterium]